MLYLWSQVTPYVVGTLEELASRGSIINCVYWDNRGIHSRNYVPKAKSSNIFFEPRSIFSNTGLVDLMHSIEPEIVVISGWMDSGYIKAISQYRSKCDTKTVCCIDDQWHGTIRQRLGRIYYRLFYKRIFDYMWVSGPPQYYYASRFGYNLNNIIYDLYSASYSNLDISKSPLNRRFIFVGRLSSVKGIDILLEAYSKIPPAIRQKWPLTFIGSGPMSELIDESKIEHVTSIPYLGPRELKKELLRGGVGVLPSRREPWGVVVHEFTQFGLPLILSEVCGAKSRFLINNYNGFDFLMNEDAVENLRIALLNMTRLSDQELHWFSRNSYELSKSISPISSASNLLSIVR